MVERAVGAQLAHINAVIGVPSHAPPFMTSWKRSCCSICSVVCRARHALVLCAGLLSSVSARFGLRSSLCTPSRGHPLLGCRLLSVCHVHLLLYRCLRAFVSCFLSFPPGSQSFHHRCSLQLQKIYFHPKNTCFGLKNAGGKDMVSRKNARQKENGVI